MTLQNNGTSHHSYDAVVVGGGIIGKSIAFELARSSVRVLLIYPQQQNSDGASLASGAMLGAYGEITADQETLEEQLELEFRIKAQKIYPDWIDSVREASKQDIFTTQGTFIIGNSAGDRDRANLKRMKAQLETYNEPHEWVDPEDVPGLDTNNSCPAYQALFIPGEGSVDSHNLLSALEVAIAQHPKGEVLNDKVVKIDFGDTEGTWNIQTENHGCISTPNVVVCAGAKVPEVIGETLFSKLKLPAVLFGKGTSCILADAPHFPHTLRTPNRSFACGLHVVPRSGGRLYIGATNSLSLTAQMSLGVQPQDLLYILGDGASQFNTALRNTRIEEMRYGLRPIPSDGIPLVGKTAFSGLFVATGTYRNGMLMAPLVAQVVTAELLGKQSPTENVFSPMIERRRNENPFQRLLDVGARDLMATVREPGGFLPYNRTRELESFVRLLFEMGVLENSAHAALRDKAKQMMRDVPLDEVFLSIYYEFIKTAVPSSVPQVNPQLTNGKAGSVAKSAVNVKG
ncbi:NAD(P)/FAD-dependent oxidoreductase [Coleofasciculus sp.]|uniref:NAD(P)/FAD-dependent oxidoreductase n=1 Tax=Coleofasciculus sp. TaxID=3100458 RepID=UPI0039F8F615